ncbi:MAG: carboxypeptidase regulatory-like domain-containing protein [Acidobacteriota bacterium]|nr:MAG: carboxypeptidase regulatory-like domain-containing protein [Acidobacteriota bacterium]
MTRRYLPILLLPVLVFALQANSVANSSSGNLSGLLLNEAGRPLANLVVSLLSSTTSQSLPTLARTDAQGRIFLKDLAAGTYQLMVKSARYRSPERRMIEILPNRTAVVTLILQQVFGVEEGFDENLGIKALLRGSQSRRLVFRHNTDPQDIFSGEDGPKRLFQDAVFQVYTNSGLGGNYFVFPGDPWGGTSTNFAVVDSLGGNSDYVFAGQLNSGQDSIWRLRNVLRFEMSDRHSLHVFLGYGRISFDQPSLSLLDNPGSLRDEPGGFTSASSNSQLLNLGFEDRHKLGSAVTLTWGLELDQFRGFEKKAFLSPSAGLEIRPAEKTLIKLQMASKRSTTGNTLALPEGDQISLANPLQIARVGNIVSYGTARHYQAQLTQYVGSDNQLEFALFEDSMFSGSVPIVAVWEVSRQMDLLRLQNHEAFSRGYRFTMRRKLSQNLSAEISFVRAQAPGVDGSLDNLNFFNERSQLVERRRFNAISTRIDAFVPRSQTQLTALIKVVPSSNPLIPLDLMSDVYETGNEGFNLFVRQILPLPDQFLGLLGLEFLTPERIEALIDIRNLLGQDLGDFQTSDGTIRLVQNPRSVRGGIAFRF